MLADEHRYSELRGHDRAGDGSEGLVGTLLCTKCTYGALYFC